MAQEIGFIVALALVFITALNWFISLFPKE